MKCAFPLVIVLLTTELAYGQPALPQVIDEAAREALSSWRAPGLALAIVKDNQVIYLKAHGVRELGGKDSVTIDTVFPLASCTKSFTSLAAGMLVDDGKLDWDDLVRKHVPSFRLADPLADAQVTLRDLMTHRTGIDRHEMLWYRSPWSFEERMRRIGLIKPEKPFRAAFEYQAVLYGAAGHAAGKAAGSTWQDLVQQRIVAPLGMKRTTFTTTEAFRLDDLATPHRKDRQGNIRPIPWYQITEPDPAGSINSTARDLAAFLKLQLSGVWNGKRLISVEALREPQTPQVAIRPDPYIRIMNPDTLQISYGMGWVIQDYRGELLLMHGGVIDGFRAHFTLLPRRNIGIVLLNNLHGTQLNLSLSNTLIDVLLGLGYKDWHGHYQKVAEWETRGEEERARSFRTKQIQGTRPTLALDAYLGEYHDDAYGKATFTLADSKLVLQVSTFTVPLEHYHYDTFVANNADFSDATVQFLLNEDGQPATVRMFEREFRKRGAR